MPRYFCYAMSTNRHRCKYLNKNNGKVFLVSNILFKGIKELAIHLNKNKINKLYVAQIHLIFKWSYVKYT